MESAPKEYKYDWPIDATLDVIGGKWKPLIVYALNDETLRFGQLLEKLQPRITQRMLTKQLRQLEEDGLITRKVYAQVLQKWNIRSRKWVSPLCRSLTSSALGDLNIWVTELGISVKNRWRIFIKSFIKAL